MSKETPRDLTDRSFGARFWAYLEERFPPAAYSVLVALFFGSAVLVARHLGGGDIAWLGAVVVLLVFFHLRVFDEHKDFDADVKAYPERVLSRGWVTLADLRVAGVVAITLEFLISMLIGPWAVGVWAATLVFTLLMFKEFFLGDWLRDRLVLYAITHNPVVAGLAMFGWAASGARWQPDFLAYVFMVSVASLGFEVGRKVRLPDEEIPGVDSYSSVLGRGGALRFLWGTMLLSALGLVATLNVLGAGHFSYLGLLALAPGLLVTTQAPAKRVELGATLVLFLCMLISGGYAWL